MKKIIQNRFVLTMACALASSISSHAQSASATISSQQLNASLWLYTITLTDTGATDISSLWYAWTPDVPPYFYLPPGTLSNISGQSGWSGSAVANSIQFTDDGNGDNGYGLTTGQSVNLFYEATFSPASLAATPHSGLAVGYEGAVDASASTGDFNVTTVVPEPSSLGLMGMGLAGLVVRGKYFGRRLKK